MFSRLPLLGPEERDTPYPHILFLPTLVVTRHHVQIKKIADLLILTIYNEQKVVTIKDVGAHAIEQNVGSIYKFEYLAGMSSRHSRQDIPSCFVSS